MTEEQIKQNAHDFAFVETDGISILYHPCKRGYIAGAHSCDEEIKELKKRLKFADESIADADKWIAKYQLENYELRNPWISVKDRLPEKAIGKSERSEYVLCRHKNGNYYVAYWHVGLEYWYSMPYKIDKNNITHWMPIPEV